MARSNREMLRNTGLAAAATAVALLLAEGVVRLAGAAPDAAFVQHGRFRLSSNPRLGYELVPHLEYHGADLERWDWSSRSNSLGFRGPEPATTKLPGTLRILVLGDSITAGLGVPDDAAVLPAVLGRLLGERGVAAEVLNFGVSGYNTQQEIETLRTKGLALRPDVVVLAYCLNDAQPMEPNILRGLEAAAARGVVPESARPFPLLGRSALYRFLRFRVLADPVRLDPLGDAAAAPEASIRELASLSRTAGFRTLVAIFPVFGDLDAYPHADRHAALGSVVEAAGLESLDLLPALRGCARRAPVALDTLHPNAFGHACAAQALADALVATGSGGEREAIGE